MALRLALLALVAAAGCALLAHRVRTVGPRRFWLAACGASGVATVYLLLAAIFLSPQSPPRFLAVDGTPSEPLHVPDADLGYAHRPGARVRALREVDGVVTYDVVYTIGDDGRRLVPGDPGGAPVLFLGCSYTFGEGVRDDETLPARLDAALGERAHVVNHAVGGYGAHQVLRALETGRAPVPRGAHVFYQGLADHVRRVAGRAPWDGAGPRYARDGDGVAWTGPLHAPPVRLVRRIADGLVRRGLLPEAVFPRTVSDDERELYVRVVARAAELVRAAGGRFTVLFWDDTPVAAALADRLEQRGLEVWRVTTLLPEVDLASGSLRLSPGDSHPSARLYQLLATAVAQRMASEPPR